MKPDSLSYFTLVFLMVSALLAGQSELSANTITPEDLLLNNIEVSENGYLEKTDGDPYIIFPEIEQPYCESIGVELTIVFKSTPVKPVLLEIFWSTEFLGFGEENKVFFTLQPQKDRRKYHFIVPLYQSERLTQIRLDFPRDLATPFTIATYQIALLDDVSKDIEILDVYQSLTIERSQKPDILIPYLLKALVHGPQRLSQDVAFLFFWLSTITGLLYLIRRFAGNQPEKAQTHRSDDH